MSPEERYAAICQAFLNHPEVTQPAEKKNFGSATLRVQNKIFAMLVRGNLVVKLPANRVDALIASGAGVRYEPGPGRPMKEWLSVPPPSANDNATWLSLANEAYAFVKG